MCAAACGVRMEGGSLSLHRGSLVPPPLDEKLYKGPEKCTSFSVDLE